MFYLIWYLILYWKDQLTAITSNNTILIQINYLNAFKNNFELKKKPIIVLTQYSMQ